jgi:hypothetical protein
MLWNYRDNSLTMLGSKNVFLKGFKMRNIKSTRALSVIAVALFSVFVVGEAVADPFTFDGSLNTWNGFGNAGATVGDGVVGASSQGGQYGYVSTVNSLPPPSIGIGIGAEKNGSYAQSDVFSVNSGDTLSFLYNYVTPDAGAFSDYSWARLIDANDTTQFFILFDTLVTQAIADFNHGFTTQVFETATPTTEWSKLGVYSGRCYSDEGAGCGNTGWLAYNLKFDNAGDYILEFGVVNRDDTTFDSGLAFDDIKITEASTPEVPEPASLALLGLGLIGMGALRRRKSA